MTHLEAARELCSIVSACESRFLALRDEDAAHASGPEKWSRKEILGHLIDSAANNHQRFIRLQTTPELHFPGYEQNDWVRLSHYAIRPWREIVTLWVAYNRHLADVIAQIAPEALGNVWDWEEGRYTLEFIAADYVRHLRHHIEQIERGS
jgi:DinB superfamily